MSAASDSSATILWASSKNIDSIYAWSASRCAALVFSFLLNKPKKSSATNPKKVEVEVDEDEKVDLGDDEEDDEDDLSDLMGAD